MKSLLIVLILLPFAGFTQVKLNRAYTYETGGKVVSFEKGRKMLQSGRYIANISDQDSIVHIIKSISLKEGDAFPFETFKTLNGKIITPEELAGKVVVINFWFKACRPCQVEIPQLNEAVRTFEGREVVFLAFANDKSATLIPFLKKKPFHYQIIPNSMDFGIRLGVRAYPTHLIVDREGKIREILVGGNAGIGARLTREISRLVE